MRAMLRILLALTLALALFESCASPPAHAADLSLPLFAQAQPKAGGIAVVESKSYVVEAVVVAALFGVALFAVCRSSRRG